MGDKKWIILSLSFRRKQEFEPLSVVQTNKMQLFFKLKKKQSCCRLQIDRPVNVVFGKNMKNVQRSKFFFYNQDTIHSFDSRSIIVLFLANRIWQTHGPQPQKNRVVYQATSTKMYIQNISRYVDYS